ncbi:Bicarbonate transport ATP-binding protein CmpD [anaerobic digester metagenome]|jgi:ABC-type nitrate/sulfonate/bicarbonate transport system ATPase subunit
MLASLRNVSKVFANPRTGKGLVALNDVSIEVEQGDFLCLIGPSGCGKSTTLNLLAGFEHPSEGEVRFKGKPIAGPSPERGVVFQEFSLYPWMDVLHNVAFSVRTGSGSEREEVARRYLGMVGLLDFAHAMPNELSGGMKQRVAIARTLAMDPDLLLMDEPFGSLDEQTRRKLDNEVLSLWEGQEKTVVFVTHSIEEALMLGTRVVLMSASPGRVNKEWRIESAWPRDPLSPEMTALKKDIVKSLQVCSCANGSPRGGFITMGGLED